MAKKEDVPSMQCSYACFVACTMHLLRGPHILVNKKIIRAAIRRTDRSRLMLFLICCEMGSKISCEMGRRAKP